MIKMPDFEFFMIGSAILQTGFANMNFKLFLQPTTGATFFNEKTGSSIIIVDF